VHEAAESFASADAIEVDHVACQLLVVRSCLSKRRELAE